MQAMQANGKALEDAVKLAKKLNRKSTAYRDGTYFALLVLIENEYTFCKWIAASTVDTKMANRNTLSRHS